MKTANEFYAFFEKIPEEKWCKGRFGDDDCAHCAFGHLGLRAGLTVYHKTNAQNLADLFYGARLPWPATVNDQPGSARDNILEALQVCAELGL